MPPTLGEAFRKLCGCLQRRTKPPAKFAGASDAERNLPQSLLMPPSPGEAFRKVCGCLQRRAKLSAKFAEGFISFIAIILKNNSVNSFKSQFEPALQTTEGFLFKRKIHFT